MVSPADLFQIAHQAGLLLDKGYHCSEAVFWAGRQVFPDEVLPSMQKITTPFAGGVGGTNAGLCGALTGGIILIGALYGRMDGNQADHCCQDFAERFYRSFSNEFGFTICKDLKEHWRGKPGQESCTVLVEKAVLCLFAVLNKEKN